MATLMDGYTPISRRPTLSSGARHAIAIDSAGGSKLNHSSHDVFIQVTPLGGWRSPIWHVAPNDPTEQPVTLRLAKGTPITALHVPSAELRIGAGEWVVLDQAPK